MKRANVGIVHLGIGAFFRAFGLPYLQDAMAAAGGDWGVIGVSLRSAGVRDNLRDNDFVYHTLERGAEGQSVARITALRDVLVAPENPAAVVAAMADPAVHIVSLTVTEKGYCHAPATGRLDMSHPGIVQDLENLDAPTTAPGFITAALAWRKAAGLRPFTCLSCDNLPGNGPVLRGVILDFARRVDGDLADWIEAEGCFPATMIDRIVPATTKGDIDTVEAMTGIRDTGAVTHEPFRQWVIEDDFVDGNRPALERAGAQLVADVAPFEHMKLRCLNGSHSALAYLGVLCGKETIAEATEDATLRTFVEALWATEIIPSFAPPEGSDPQAYVGELMQRFRNPGIQHRTIQIAMDGSQKLPQRILASIADNLAAGRPIDRLALVVAAWFTFLRGVNEAGAEHGVNDPLSERLQTAALSVDPVGSVLAIEDVFVRDLAADQRFREAVEAGYHALVVNGVTGALQEAIT